MVKKTLTDSGLKENEVEEINCSPKKKSVPKKEVIQEESKYESEPKTIKEEKKQEIKEFNDNPRTKEYGVKLVSRKTYAGIWIFASLLILLLFINMIWGNSILSKVANKDFKVDVGLGDIIMNSSNENIYNHTIINNNYNNYTIVNNNTIAFPEEILIKMENSS